MIVIAMVVGVLALILTAYWVKTKRHSKSGKELVIVSELPETGAFGVVLILLGFVMFIGKLAGMEIGGAEESSYPFVAVFGLILVLFGCEVMLMTIVKKVIAYKDRIEAYSSFGNIKSIPWSEVTQVKVPYLSRRATFKSEDVSISVNGKREDYLEFALAAKKYVPAVVASDDLGRLLRKLGH